MLNSAMLTVHRSWLSNTRSSLLMWSCPARPMFHTQLLSTYAKRVCSSHSVLGFSSFFSSGFASPGLVSGGAWAIGTGASGFWKRLCAYAGALNATPTITAMNVTPSHRVIRSSSRLDCVVSALAGSDTKRLLERRADLVGYRVGDDDFHFHLRQEVDSILAAAVHLRVAFLPAEPPHLAQRLDDRLELPHRLTLLPGALGRHGHGRHLRHRCAHRV